MKQMFLHNKNNLQIRSGLPTSVYSIISLLLLLTAEFSPALDQRMHGRGVNQPKYLVLK